MRTILCSGGFDPLHVGHLDYLEAASAYGHVIVALNSESWLRRKKGRSVMSHADRTRILKALVIVTDVTPVNDADGTVAEAIRRIRPDYFANGGDRTEGNPTEHAVCEDLDIEEIFGVGGAKIRSSSELWSGALFTTVTT